jgi:hypothetical protein
MGRIFNLVLLAVMIVGAAVTYDMKYRTETAAERIARLQAEIAREKQTIQTLKAEWSLLDQPSRLQALVDRHADYFQLQPFSSDQVVTIDQIPQKPVEPDPIGALAGVPAGTTGSIE